MHRAAGSPPEAAASCDLCAVYDDMSASFAKDGLSLDVVTETRFKFDIQEGLATPLRYSEMGLAPSAVRLVVAPLTASQGLVGQGVAVTRSIRQIIPADWVVLENEPHLYHITLFHTSQSFDPRPDPFDANAAVDAPPASRPVITTQTMQQELQTVQRLAGRLEPIQMEVYRVVFAKTGTLLLCCIDPSGQLAHLRQQMRASFPGASTKQTSIMHVTLARLLTPEQLSPAIVAEVQGACDMWTQKLRDTRFTLDRLWHLREHIFAQVTGKRVEMMLEPTEVASFR